MWHSRATSLLLALLVCALSLAVTAQTRHDVRGMVLKVDPASRTVVVSHDAIPGVMPAMTMPFEVRSARELTGVMPGASIAFALVLDKQSPYIEGVRVVRYDSVEQDPVTARRLRLLQDLTRPRENPVSRNAVTAFLPVRIGQMVPDFTLIDQTRARVSLSQFRGKVVALNFVYTSCVLPQFCYRLANHFSVVQRRFGARMGRDLVLLTVTFDPARDTPERLAEYAGQWKADPAVWRFLTGDEAVIAKVGRHFGLDAFPDEGLISHSTRTVVINRAGALAASIEGNQYTAAQLGDLLEAVVQR
jgi:protein SCO1/2